MLTFDWVFFVRIYFNLNFIVTKVKKRFIVCKLLCAICSSKKLTALGRVKVLVTVGINWKFYRAKY